MDEKIIDILNNVTDKSIATLGIMLADADNLLRAKERDFKLAMNNKSAPLDQSVLGTLALAMNPQEITKQMEMISKAREDNARLKELEYMDQMTAYRQVAIAFDTAKLIVDNRKKEN